MATIAFVTFGCALNQADSEAMAGLLEQAGHCVIETPQEADLVIINSCTVKNLAEKKLFKEIAKHPEKKMVIAGCVPQADARLAATKLKKYSIIGTRQIDKVVSVVQQTLDGEVVQLLKTDTPTKRVLLPTKKKHKTIAILPINEGCMSNCTYCKTKHARGNNYSYPVQEIKKKMEEAVQEGATEIWLTSQDTGCYGLDSNTNLPQLLEELLTIRGDYRIRLGMLNPTYALVFLKKLIVVMQHPKMFKFLHIPVQSGNNRVLKAMARGYKVDAFVKMVNAFREAIPKITISTDIIVGFPTETEEEFQDTLQLIKDIKPEVCNISRFWLRPGTKAEEMEQVHGQVSKVRSQELTKVFHKIVLENNASWKDWEGEVLIQEVSAPNNTIARNDWYKQIILREELNPGTRHLVTIVKTTRYDLRGELRE